MGIIKNKLNKATEKLTLMNSLEKLKKDLQKLGPTPRGKEIYNYGVNFFNIIASFQDNNALDIELLKKTTENAKDLASHISNSGRDQYGWVRAPRGEQVTLHNLYLGNIYGLWTKPASYWQDCSEKDAQSIIQNQLSSFINYHREPMINLITDVLAKNKKPNSLIVKKLAEKKTRVQ